MTPSIEERREAVKIIRAMGTEFTCFASCSDHGAVEAMREGGCSFKAAYLADLIEPLPERTCTMHRDGHGIWHCSSCEASDERDAGIMPWYDSWPPSFCPNCGAKVVEP